MKIALFCWRPYHVFSAINLVKNDIEGTSGKTTLFLYDYANIIQMKSELEKTGLFNEVVVINDYKQKAQYFKKIMGLIFSKIALKRHVDSIPAMGFSYDKLITTSCNVILFEFIHANPESSIVLFEDGTLAYVADEIEHGMNTHLRRIKFLLKMITRKTDIIAKYVYEPSLVVARGYKLKRLPKVNDEVVSIQKKVFSYNQPLNTSIYHGKKIIYLDERYPKEYFKDGMSEEEVFNLLSKYKEEVILRPHPGNEPGTNLFDLDTQMQSWELTCRDVLSEKSVLITKTSTASITPYLIYGVKVHIIFLADLLFKKTEGEEQIVQGLYDRLRYKEIYRPKSLQEFESLLERLL